MEKPKHLEVVRELDYRHIGGVGVWLYWYAGTEVCSINYLDEYSGESYKYDVEPGFNKNGKSNASEAFHHPNAYIPEDGKGSE